MSRTVVAALRRTRGNKGELIATSLSSHPDRFERLRIVYLRGKEFTVERTWLTPAGDVVFKFAGIDSISAAEPLAGIDVEIPSEERIETEPGEYFLSDLVGCSVVDRDEPIGTVSGWQELPGQVLLEAGKLEIPFGLVKKVDLEAKRIDVELPIGFRELYS